MYLTLKRTFQSLRVLTSREPCGILMTSLVFLIIAMAMLDVADCETTTAPKTTEEPFLESSMFIGLAIGLGSVMGFLIILCIVWKCCCGGRE